MRGGRLAVVCGACAVAALAAGGEILYNGIVLPEKWPPRIDPLNRAPLRAPYLDPQNIPVAIPIDVGRQLFVDDFLVGSSTGVVRKFNKPVKCFFLSKWINFFSNKFFMWINNIFVDEVSILI